MRIFQKRNMKKTIISIYLFLIYAALTVSLSAQEKFDVVTFTAPKGWTKSVEQNAVQFTKQDGNAVGIMMLFKSLPTDKDSKTTFDASWEAIVKGLFDKVDSPQMQPTMNENGWMIENGAAIVEKDGSKAVANLISATGGGKVVNLLIIFNNESFQTDVEAFISSLNLPKVSPTVTTNNPTVTANAGNQTNSSIVGIWADNLLETSGYANNIPQYSGGYFRKEYKFNSDGTYLFLTKNWSVYAKSIIFIYEKGTFSVNGNKLTVTPTSGKSEEWSKSASNRTSEWGALLKSQNRKLEKITYTFEIKYYSGSQSSALELYSNTPTERDGRSNNEGNEQKFSYAAKDKSVIDFPPGKNIQ